MDSRGQAIPVNDWWLRLARSVVANDTRDFRTLGKELARHVKRRAPFDHGMLSRFATGRPDSRTGKPISVTYELVLALCAEFSRLPSPVFLPRNYEEAVHMQAVQERFDNTVGGPDDGGTASVVPLPTEGRRRRKRIVDEHADDAPASRRRAAR